MCVFVCQWSYLRNYTSDLHPILCMISMAMARSSSGGVVIRYVSLLPVLWMTWYLFKKPRLLEVAAQLNPTAHAALGLAIKCAKLQANGRTGLLFGRLNYVPRLQHRGGVCGLWVPCCRTQDDSIFRGNIASRGKNEFFSSYCKSVCFFVKRRVYIYIYIYISDQILVTPLSTLYSVEMAHSQPSSQSPPTDYTNVWRS